MNLPRVLAGTIALAAVGASQEVTGADITRSSSDACVLSISGELVRGDYDRFTELAKATYPDEVMESTAANTVCLDSPGGSLSEGVKFARHFYKEGVGTVVEDGASCHSACAIMFMMGTAQGPEVAFVSRKLHARGTLGFHRPYLIIESGPRVDAATLAVAYDNAFQSALDLVAMANVKSPWTNTPMMRPDLVEAMLAHVGNDMFLVDTVDRASRFDVELFGFEQPTAFGEAEAFYACQNSLQWQKGLTTDDITYVPTAPGSVEQRAVKEIDRSDGAPVYEVTGLASGYAREGCVVFREQGSIKACGVDEYTMTQLGGGNCGITDYRQKGANIPSLATLNPATKLASLVGASGGRSVSATPSTPVATATRSSDGGTRCYVRRGSAIEDDEPCTPVPGRTAEGRDTISFVWPSGGKTVLVMQAGGLEINGVGTVPVDREGFGRCYPNARTGKEFCVASVQ